jgi:AcrR family transcriptional regulator
MARMSADERRALLIDAAITVMAREGVAHTTTRAIVAEAGMQIGVFHYCFRSKEELILQVMQSMSRRTFAAVAGVLTMSRDPEELIQLATRAYWTDIAANPHEHLLSYELTQHALRQPGDEDAAVVQYANYYTGMEEFLTNIASIAGFSWRTPVDVLGRFVLAAIEGITIQWLVSRDEPMALALLDRLAAQLREDAGLAQ